MWVRPLVKNSSLLLAVVPDKVLTFLQKAPSGRLFYYWALNGAALALLLVSWLNPNHYLPWIVFENEAAAFASALLAALALLVQGRKVFVASSYIVFVITMALAVVAQYFLGAISWQVFGLGSLYLSAFFLCIVVGYGLRQDQTPVADSFEKIVLFIALLGAAISAGVVLCQWLRTESYYPLFMSENGNLRPYGNLGQPNNQATLLLTGVLCVELLLRKKAIRVSVACVCMLLLIPALSATGSRTALLSAIVAAAYLLVIGRARKFGFTLGWVMAFLVCFFMLPELGSFGGTEALGTRISPSLSDSPRIQIYRQLIWAIAERPWAGYGWMQTAYAQSLAAADVFGGVEVDYAHNIGIDFLVWFGIPIGVLLLLLFGNAVVGSWLQSTVPYKIAYVLLVPFVVHSLLELPFAYAFFSLPAGTLLGYLGAHGLKNNVSVWTPLKIGWRVVAPVFVVAALLAIVVFNDYLNLAEDFRVLRFENRNVGSVPEGFQQSSPLILKDLRFMMDTFRYKPRREESKEFVAQLRYYVLRGHYPGAHVKLISLELLDQRFDLAATEIRRFKNLYGEGIVKWGMSSLRDAYCEDPVGEMSTRQACCILPGERLCNRESRQRSEMQEAN